MASEGYVFVSGCVDEETGEFIDDTTADTTAMMEEIETARIAALCSALPGPEGKRVVDDEQLEEILWGCAAQMASYTALLSGMGQHRGTYIHLSKTGREVFPELKKIFYTEIREIIDGRWKLKEVLESFYNQKELT